MDVKINDGEMWVEMFEVMINILFELIGKIHNI